LSTNLPLVRHHAAVGTKVAALIDSDSYRVAGSFAETKLPVIKLGERFSIYL